jgi:hypothetical protein
MRTMMMMMMMMVENVAADRQSRLHEDATAVAHHLSKQRQSERRIRVRSMHSLRDEHACWT